MSNEGIYRTAGVSGLLSIALVIAELPLYLSRGPMPSRESAGLVTYATHNAWNMLAVVALDVLICALLLVFLSGFRRLIANTQRRSMWLATQIFGAGLVYAAVVLFGDALQASAAINALSASPDPSFIRVFLDGRYPFFGAMGLIFSALLLAAAGYIAQASRNFPRVTAWIGYVGAIVCLALVPLAAAGGPRLSALAETAQWGTMGAVGVIPLGIWMLAVVIQMMRQPEPQRAVR